MNSYGLSYKLNKRAMKMSVSILGEKSKQTVNISDALNI